MPDPAAPSKPRFRAHSAPTPALSVRCTLEVVFFHTASILEGVFFHTGSIPKSKKKFRQKNGGPRGPPSGFCRLLSVASALLRKQPLTNAARDGPQPLVAD